MIPSQSSEAPFTLTLFGPMLALVQGQPLPPLHSRKGLWLLALLTLRHDRPVEREWLTSTLWPDSDQTVAFTNLRKILSGLRSSLGDQRERLQAPNSHTLQLDLADANVDVIQFDAAIASGKLSELERAVALYRGPLLEGCYEEWMFQERAGRERHCLQALQKLGDAALSEGDYVQAVGHYRRAVGIDAWWEAARRGWMEALARSGDINAALQVYREFVAYLRDDPKATPDEQTSALYQRLRAETHQRTGTHAVVTAEAVVIPVVKGYLPHPLTDLVGREDECMEVALQLRRSRLVTLTGMGGIGKTRLAREVASDVVREYKDGVWLVALEALSEGRLVVQQVASMLGMREERGRTPLQMVTEHLRQKRLLLVLDNCEHLLEASAQVAAHLLQECGEVRILATSRAALGITGEAVWDVPVLAVPDPERLPQGPTTLLRVLMGYEGVQLFVERAQAVQKSFALSGSNALAVAQVCRSLEGIPLAIELAAARVKALTIEQVASRLEDHLSLLTVGNRTAQLRQQTLRDTLDWSYGLLSEPERALLRRLSVFVGGWRLEAAEQVCARGRVAAEHVLNLLTSLVDKSLVLFEEREPTDGRYRLLEMVRQYAAEGLQASGEVEQVKTRHRDWFLALAEEAVPQLQGAEQGNWLRRLGRDHDNLRAALAWSETQSLGAEAGLRLAGALYPFWDMRGDFSEGRAYLGRALEREDAQEATAVRAKALSGAGALAQRQGDYASARALHERSLAIRRGLGDRGGIATSLSHLGTVALHQNDGDTSRTLFEESLAIRRELGEKRSIAHSLNNLGNVAHAQGENSTARTLFEESLALFREVEDKASSAHSLNNLGTVALNQGDYKTAKTLFEESLAIRRELGDRGDIANALNNLGNAAFYQHNYEAARTLYEESLAVSRELGDLWSSANSLNNMGSVALNQGDYKTAKTLFEESLAIRQELGDKGCIVNSLAELGRVSFFQGDFDTARTLLLEGLALCREIRHFFILDILSTLGRVEQETGDYVRAATLYQECLLLSREMGDVLATARSLKDFAGLAGRQGQWERTVRLFGAAEAIGAKLGGAFPVAVAEEYERPVAAARAALSEDAFATTWESGRALTIEQAVADALETSSEIGLPVKGRNE